MTINALLLREIADKIESDPLSYAQFTFKSFALMFENGERDYDVIWEFDNGSHVCGTAFCIAGWAMQLNGWTAQRRRETDASHVRYELLDWIDPEGVNRRDQVDAWAVGAELLGLKLRDELTNIFAVNWGPREGLSVPEALRAVASGASLLDVSIAGFVSIDELDGRTPLPLDDVRALAREGS